MTVFLDFGYDQNFASNNVLTDEDEPAKNIIASNEYDAHNSFHSIYEKVEGINEGDYINIVIAFQPEASKRFVIKRIAQGYQKHLRETISLLKRLKSKYCLRVILFGDLYLNEIQYKDQGSSILKLVDYYVLPSDFTKKCLQARSIKHVNFRQTRIELASIGLWDY